MISDREQRNPPNQDINTSGAANITSVPSSDRGTRSDTMRNAQSYRFLALALGIPTLLIMSVGAFLALQDNSFTRAQSLDREATYAALEQSLSGNVGASIHAGDVDSLIGRLEEGLKAQPDDVDGWRVLGWSHFRKQNFEKAAEAYRRAVELNPGDPVLKSLHGEALVAAANGQVTVEALSAFKATLVLHPNDVRARFYSGQAEIQNGDVKSALDTWIDLLTSAPEDAEWAADLRERILEVSRQSGTDVSSSLPPPSRTARNSTTMQNRAGPTAKDMESASRLTPRARNTMARDMVERLATRLETSPNDPDGWIMLIRSRIVLSEQAEAKAGLKRALDVFAESPEIKRRIRLAAQALGVTIGE